MVRVYNNKGEVIPLKDEQPDSPPPVAEKPKKKRLTGKRGKKK